MDYFLAVVFTQNPLGADKFDILTNEIIIVARLKLEPAWLRCKWPERDRHKRRGKWFITNGNYSRIRVGYPTCLVFDFGHVVNDVLFRLILVRARLIVRTNDVNLIVFELKIAFVYIYYMIVIIYSKSAKKLNENVNNEFNFQHRMENFTKSFEVAKILGQRRQQETTNST